MEQCTALHFERCESMAVYGHTRATKILEVTDFDKNIAVVFGQIHSVSALWLVIKKQRARQSMSVALPWYLCMNAFA